MAASERLALVMLMLLGIVNGGVTNQESGDVKCGTRYVAHETESTGLLNGREEDPANLSAPTQSFPWLVKIVVVEPLLDVLCGGVIATSLVVIAPAHCITGIPPSTIRVLVGQERPDMSSIHDVAYHVENAIIHPDYNASLSANLADIAVIKLEPRRDIGPIQFSRFSNPSCLPEESQGTNCQVAGWTVSSQGQGSLRSAIVAHTIHLEDQGCSTKFENDRADSSVICSDQRCNRFVIGPVFCSTAGGQYQVAGLPGSGDVFCNSGAYTRVFWFKEWLEKTIKYLDDNFTSLDTVNDNEEVEKVGKLEAEEALTEVSEEETRSSENGEEENENSCSSNPCGYRAKCWSGQAGTFLCTCDPDYPKGNPYTKCVRCSYDNHCPSGQRCQNEECVGEESTKPAGFSLVGSKYYFVSEEAFPWLQAQYDCMNREGHLIELTTDVKTQELQNYLMTRYGNVSFWVGASDLETEGVFRWFYSGDEFNKRMWDTTPDASKKEHCVQLNQDLIKFSGVDCETTQRYICEYVPEIYLPDTQGNGLQPGTDSAEGRARSFDTLNPNSHYSQICGRKFVRNSRIVGGGVAKYGEWPWQVSLRQYKGGQFKHKCGAALLTDKWIITAAHCVKDISPSNLMVRIGEYNVLNRDEAHPHRDRRIRKVVTHKLFDKFTYEYDIALLEIHGGSLDFQPNVIPVCLPTSSNKLVGQTGWVTGWGRLSEFGQISPVLREVSLPIISNSECMKMYRRSGQNEYIPNIFICAGTSHGGQDSCEGDSGGPLVVQGKNGRWQLAGIISWGIGCGDRNRPGVYTRISEFRSWIQNVIN